MCVAGGVAPGLWVSHASGGSEIEIILQNRQSTVLHFAMPAKSQQHFGNARPVWGGPIEAGGGEFWIHHYWWSAWDYPVPEKSWWQFANAGPVYARLKLEEARSQFIIIDSWLGATQCLWSLCNILQVQGQYEEARLKMGEVCSEFIIIGDRLGATQCLQCLGDMLRVQGQYEDAQLKLEEARSEFIVIGDRFGATRCLQSLGDILQMQGQYEEAQLKLEEVHSQFIMQSAKGYPVPPKSWQHFANAGPEWVCCIYCTVMTTASVTHNTNCWMEANSNISRITVRFRWALNDIKIM